MDRRIGVRLRVHGRSPRDRVTPAGGREGVARRDSQWWAPHDRARRSAELLLAARGDHLRGVRRDRDRGRRRRASAIGQVGSGEPHSVRGNTGSGRCGSRGVRSCSSPRSAALIALRRVDGLGRRCDYGSPTRPAARRRRSGARASATSSAFALGVGFPTPRRRRRRRPGAQRLRDRPPAHVRGVPDHAARSSCPPDQLDALCARRAITSVANRALPLTCAAADLVLVARWFTKAVWGLLGVLLVSTLSACHRSSRRRSRSRSRCVVAVHDAAAGARRPGDPAPARPVAAQLADLNAVSAHQPAGAARAAAPHAAANDRRTIATPWQIAHLWFDPDTKRRPPADFERRFESWLDPLRRLRASVDSGREAAAGARCTHSSSARGCSST